MASYVISPGQLSVDYDGRGLGLNFEKAGGGEIVTEHELVDFLEWIDEALTGQLHWKRHLSPATTVQQGPAVCDNSVLRFCMEFELPLGSDEFDFEFDGVDMIDLSRAEVEHLREHVVGLLS